MTDDIAHVLQLKQDIFEREQEFVSKELALQQTIRTDTFFSTGEGEDENGQLLRKISDELLKRRELSTQLAPIEYELVQTHDKIAEEEKQIRDLRFENLALQNRIQARQPPKIQLTDAEKAKLLELQGQHVYEHRRNVILRTLIMHIVLEAHLPWQSDQTLLSLMLRVQSEPVEENLVIKQDHVEHLNELLVQIQE
ncbi:hypothetical protein BLNAU_8909 [Blattamonas nauphoetae]|uniref:Centromere protein H C-terminal domain-containing protein n=1 Tax=Blattamonas nauphoetae TaxID=2049346 RepID=A0ABQ9XXC5_9EUKA|nr:hypothetical protein BLNAU_8909 [Blattamonas nauphoetae]